MICSTAAPRNVSTRGRAALGALLGLGLLAGLTTRAGAASASPLVVTRTADDTAPGSLRYALSQAAATGGTVTFAIPNTDPGYSSAANTDTITLSLGQLNITGSLTIAAPATPAATVVVSGANTSRVFSVSAGTVAFSNLTIQAGFSYNPGGGILNTATLALTGCTVAGNNSSNSNGGGIANSGTLTAAACLISGNTAAGFSGGFSGGGLYNTGTATLNACTLSGNGVNVDGSAGSAGGGGAYNTGSLTLNSCLVSGNSTDVSGGGINNSGGTLTLNACTLSGNGSGRGFNNSGIGGGLYNVATAQMTNCLVVNNSGYSVAGMYNGGTLTLINSTFAGNTLTPATNFGGSGVAGGGLVSGPATLVNDIFAFDVSVTNGVATPSEIVALNTTGPTVTYSDVQGGYAGTGNINLDPQFVRAPYTNSGTDTGDEHLMLTSPAAHAGTDAPGVPLTDIVGTARPAPPARPSMGAYEIPGANGFSAQGGFLVTGTQNTSTGSQVVAKFLPGPIPVASFTAAVDLGDGSQVSGVISADPTASGVFQVTVSHTYATSGAFPVTVVISGPGGTPTATVTSTATIQPFLASLAFPTPVPGGTVLTATVTLSGPAPADTVVGLSSSDSSVIRVFRSVVIPAGAGSATFAINTFRSHTTKTVTVYAALGAVTLAKDLTITGR